MEINNPNANPTVKGYLTNGLLVKELVTGRVQVADNDYFNRLPAQVPVSGDTAEFNPTAPTYASFRDVVSLDPFSKAPRVNGAVTNFIDKAGNVSQNSSYATRYPETNLVYYDETLGHNISAPMWRFMNASGLVYANKQLVNQVLEDWVFAFGLPISEPYWTRSRVAGEEKDVLVQLFERRVLTYTPSNQAAFQVEMGNVGRHYFTWRYPSGGLTETPASAEPAVRLLIPSIGVDSQIEYVGQTPSGAMDVPVKPENVAWYKLGTPVGSRGSAVITGHLDYYATGKAVFWDLNKLQVGDTYSIVTSTGRRLTFRVTKTEIYEVSQVPLSVIFGPSSTADLNLITCDGAFNASNADYSRRLVVYSTLV
jgi:sortase (surface protein transpeptidase)